MPATWTVEKTAPAGVTTPPAGKVRFFVDPADNLLKYKDELDVVRPASPDQASALLTADTPNPAIIDGTTPVAGDILVADSAIQASWRQPNQIPGLVLFESPIVTRVANFTAVIGTAHLVDISGGNVDAALPPAAAATLNQEIWFKVTGLAGGNRLRVDPDLAETIDVTEAFVDLTLTREWAKFRSDGAGNWYQFG